MSPNTVFGGDWTETKLRTLSKYLHAYTTIFERNPKARYYRRVYVDAFAGTGYIPHQKTSSTVRDLLFPELAEPEAQAYIKGSAQRALETEPGFHEYIFVERDQDRFRELEKLKERYPSRAKQINNQNTDAATFLRDWCRRTDWSKTRSVVFLDPYGMQVDWSLLNAIAATKAIDLWLLFPLGVAINRMLTHDQEPPPDWKRAITRILGTEKWESEFYSKRQVATLFGLEEIDHKEATLSSIGQFFLRRLKTIFAGVAPRPQVLRNSRNNPLYLFCFAAGNPRVAPTAIKIAQDIIGE